MIVVDASVVLAWCFRDEGDAIAERALDLVVTEGAAAPAHWPLDVANGLLTAERRRRISTADVAKARELLGALDIEIVPVELSTAGGSVLDLARKHSLSAHDAAYLGLAWFRNVALATIDEALIRASRREGVPLAT